MLTSTYHHLAIIEHDICQSVLFDRIRGNGRYNKIYNHQNFLSKLLTLYTFFWYIPCLGLRFRTANSFPTSSSLLARSTTWRARPTPLASLTFASTPTAGTSAATKKKRQVKFAWSLMIVMMNTHWRVCHLSIRVFLLVQADETSVWATHYNYISRFHDLREWISSTCLPLCSCSTTCIWINHDGK